MYYKGGNCSRIDLSGCSVEIVEVALTNTERHGMDNDILVNNNLPFVCTVESWLFSSVECTSQLAVLEAD